MLLNRLETNFLKFLTKYLLNSLNKTAKHIPVDPPEKIKF